MPSGFDLGESFKMAISSVPEGDDAPQISLIISQGEGCVLTKVDLLPL